MITPQPTYDYLDLEGNAQASLAVSTSAAMTEALVQGLYDVWCDLDVYLKVGQAPNDVTTSSGYLLRANVTLTLLMRTTKKLGAIAASSGTLRLHKVA